MKILVTGALGQLGQEIMGLSPGSSHHFLFTDVRKAEGVMSFDITDPVQVDRYVTSDVDVVINCAAYTDVEKAEADSGTAFALNAVAAGLLAEAARKADALMIHISTDYVFDGCSNRPYVEDDVPAPLNVYGRSKLAGEEAVLCSGCRHMIFRTSWLYSLSGRNFLNTMVEKTASMPQIKVVFDQTGTPTCAYDLAFLLMYIIEENMLDRTGIYNYSNEGVCSWYDFAKEISVAMGHLCRVVPCRTEEFPVKAVRPKYSVLDKRKVRETFAVEVPHWRESLSMVINQILNH